MALSELGFNRPSYDEILDEQTERAKTLFGETIDTSELSTLGKFIRINAKDIDTLYQMLEGVYYSRFPKTASGVSLDRLCVFAGISRNSAIAARHKVTITGTAGAEVEAGFEVSDEEQSVVFYTDDDYVIGENGTVTAYVECDETGTDGNILSSKINTVVNPVADVEDVIGVELVTTGEDGESDAEFRQRFLKAISGSGSGTADAIKGAVMRVNGVDDCTIIEDLENSRFKCIVSYDDTETTKQLIAQAIFEKKPIGVKTYGNIAVDVEVEGEGGEPHTIYFDATTKNNVKIQFVIATNNYFEEDGIEQIKGNIISYLSQFSNGETLYVSSLFSLIYVTGVVSASGLSVAKDNVAYTDTVTFSDGEVARTAESYIDIFGVVGSPSGSPVDNSYYEKSGNSYVLSADTSVNVNKTYYTLLNETEE